MKEEKYIDIATFEKPKIKYFGKYTLLDNLIERIKKANRLYEIEFLCKLFKMIYESKGEDEYE